MPPLLFLDNNICIDWLLKQNPEITQLIEDGVAQSSVFISEYVLGEFIRTIVLDACALHSILIESIDLDVATSRIYSILEIEDQKHIAQRYILLMDSIEYPNDPEIDYARDAIKNYFKWAVRLLKTKFHVLNSKVRCELSSEKPKRNGSYYRIDIPCKVITDESKCSIVKYIDDENSFLALIEAGIDGKSEFNKLNHFFSTINRCSPINCSIKYCKTLGDVIIVNDCPNTHSIVSRDEHFQTLCDISGHNLIYFD